MSRADYAHWNEEQDRVWWEEEGRHADSCDPLEGDDPIHIEWRNPECCDVDLDQDGRCGCDPEYRKGED